MKYIQVTNHIHEQLIKEDLTRTGLYQWIATFKGDVKRPQEIDDYEKYDIVHVNLSKQDVHLVNDIREKIGKGSSTKIVANNDYTTELWPGLVEFPSTLKRELKGADMIFGTEYHMASTIQELTGRKVYIIPHPCDTKRLKAQPRIDWKQKQDLISVLWHRYDNMTLIPSIAVNNHNKYKSQLVGYHPDTDAKYNYITTTLYDKIFTLLTFPDFCNVLKDSKICYEPFTLHSYGRTTVDTAALGIPTVGSNRVQSMNICFPHTIADPFDTKKSRELIKKLIDDEEFREKVEKTALEKVEFYSKENSREKFLKALEEGSKKIKGDIQNGKSKKSG